MLATTAYARKAIQRDGRCRLLTSRRNGRFLSFKRTDALSFARVLHVSTLRASSSCSSGPWTSTSSIIAKKDDLSLKPSFSGSSWGSSTTQSITEIGYTFESSYPERRQKCGLTLQFMPFRSFLFLGHHRNASYRSDSRLRLYPQRELRLWLSSSPSSSSTSSDTHQVEKTRQNAPGFATHAKIPIPKSSPTLSTSSNPLASIDFKAILKGSLDMTLYLTKSLFRFIIQLPGNLFFMATNPKARKEKIAEMKKSIKKEVDHYWVGIKVSMNTSNAEVMILFLRLQKRLQTGTARQFISLGQLSDLKMIFLMVFLTSASHGRCQNGSKSLEENVARVYINTSRTQATASNGFRPFPVGTDVHVSHYPIHGICFTICFEDFSQHAS